MESAVLRRLFSRRLRLGLIPDGIPGPGGTVAYWRVEDAAATVKRLEALGAKVHEPVKDVGENIKVASVSDPFDNIFGIIENPHFSTKNVE